MASSNEFVTVTKLPTWIKESTFIGDYENDYPNEPYILPKSKYYKYPKKLSDKNIVPVLEIIRYYGITDEDIFYDVFKFLFDIEPYVEYNKIKWDNIIQIGVLDVRDGINFVDKVLGSRNKSSIDISILKLDFPEFPELWRNLTFDRSNIKLDSVMNYDFYEYSTENNLVYLKRLSLDVRDVIPKKKIHGPLGMQFLF